MTMVGADPEELDALATRISAQANRLEAIKNEISSLLSVTSWCGPDAELFHGLWSGQLAGMVTSVDQALLEVAQKVRFEAQQQRSASAADGGGFGRLLGFGTALGLGAADVGSILHSLLGDLGSGVGKLGEIGKIFRILDPFGDPESMKTATNVINWIDKAPEWLAGPARSLLGDLSHVPGVGAVSEIFKGPFGKALPIVGLAIGGASIADDVYNIAHGGWTSQNEGNLLSDIGGTAMSIPYPPVMLAGGAMWLGSKIDPTWPQDAWRGGQYVFSQAEQLGGQVVQGGEAVFNDASQGLQTVVNTGRNVVNTIANAPGDVIGGIGHFLGIGGSN